MKQKKPLWRCGMCGFINPGRQWAKCAKCGARKGMGSQ
jgi:rubrerythrin